MYISCPPPLTSSTLCDLLGCSWPAPLCDDDTPKVMPGDVRSCILVGSLSKARRRFSNSLAPAEAACVCVCGGVVTLPCIYNLTATSGL